MFAGNAYLGDQIYALNGGGELIPIGIGSETPLPAALPLFATVLGAQEAEASRRLIKYLVECRRDRRAAVFLFTRSMFYPSLLAASCPG